jgi:RES domain
MKRHYRLQAEPGRYELRGSPARGILGATYTGRSIDVEGGYPEAKKWLEDYETSHGEHPELERQLLQSLGLAAAYTLEAPLFRGRFFSSPPESFQDFGPPPPDRARRGRYNTEGIPVLYLCSSVSGVVRELGTPLPGCKLWIQRFQILPELRMADARELAIDPLAAAVFWLIESGRDHSLSPPRLGERVGQLIGAEYDGLIVPGVRAEPNELYWNAVFFRPDDRWLQLVDRSAQPEEAS